MAGYFNVGEEKIRPGAYFNVSKHGDDNEFGAVDGVVAVLFRGSFGPLGTAKVIERGDGYAGIYGEGGTTDALREALYGGASKLVACRVGNGGTAETVSLDASNGKVKITAKHPGKMGFTVTIREKLTDKTRKECAIYVGTQEFEKVTFASGGNEVQALIDAFAKSVNFAAETDGDASGVMNSVTQSAFTAGEDPTVTNADYSNALKEVEKYYFNTICIDTEEPDIQELLSAFLDRIYDAGQFGIGVVAAKDTLDFDEKLAAAKAFDKANMVYIPNAKVMAKEVPLSGYQVAALIAGMIAACPSSQSLTHAVINRYTEISDAYTNTQLEKADESGCLALSYNSNDEVWIEYAINTMINLDEDHDAGWKKLRRVKTRYELMYRANAQADALVGKVDNDVNGRATIIAKIQKICNDMIQEGKLVSAEVTENTNYTADTDSCWFNIDVVDKDSAEHIYLLYTFQFSTLAAGTE